jgi:hypothetical protein
MDKKFQQTIKMSTHGVPIAQLRIRVVGGIQLVTMQTWMACIWKEKNKSYAEGIKWSKWKGYYYSLKGVTIMVRREYNIEYKQINAYYEAGSFHI